MIGHHPVTLQIEEIEATYGTYALVVAVSLKHLGSEAQKINSRATVIFKHNALRLIFKQPSYRAANGKFATKILLAKKSLDFTRPIDEFGAFLHMAAKRCLFRSIFPRPIDCNIEFRRLSGSNGCNLRCHVIRSIEANQQNWRTGKLFHIASLMGLPSAVGTSLLATTCAPSAFQ
jgi:hypothetical protein